MTFDNAGVGGSGGTTPDTIEPKARDAIAFLTAMEFGQADVLGFSIGSFVAQQIALVPSRPSSAGWCSPPRRPRRGPLRGWAAEVMGAVGTPHTAPEGYLDVFFAE